MAIPARIAECLARRRLHRSWRRRNRPALVTPACEALESRFLLSAFVVDTPADGPDIQPGDGAALTRGGQTSLRAAIQEANASPGPDTIVLPPGLFRLLHVPAGASAADDFPSASLTVSDDLTLIGAGSTATRIDRGLAATIFDLTGNASLSLGWLSLTSQPHPSITLESGHLHEIADVDRNGDIIRAPGSELEPRDTGGSSDDRPSDGTQSIPVANLNVATAATGGGLAVNSRQTELLHALYRTPHRHLTTESFFADYRQHTQPPPRTPPDAAIGILNPQPEHVADAGAATTGKPPASVRSGPGAIQPVSGSDEDRPAAAAQRRGDVIRSLFESSSDESDIGNESDGTATGHPDSFQHNRPPDQPSDMTAPADDTPTPMDEGAPALPIELQAPLPLFPDPPTPAPETELPVIRSTAPLLPAMEVELPDISVDQTPAVTPAGNSVLPSLSGLLVWLYHSRFRHLSRHRRSRRSAA